MFAEVAALDTGLLDRTPIEAMRALTARLADGDDAGRGAAPDRPRRRCSPPPWCAPRPARRRCRRTWRWATRPTSCACCAARRPATAEVAALDTYLVTVSDHGLNASTFAARVIASTRAGLTSAVLGGISALKGPLHGGAPGPIIDMLDAIGEPENARAWIEAALARGDRLMGFGHRVYRVRDPRADALKGAVRKLTGRLDVMPGRLAFAEAVEAAALAILASASPTGRCRPMWSSTPRCCWRRWPSRPRPSPASSPPAASPAGSRTPASSWPAAG